MANPGQWATVSQTWRSSVRLFSCAYLLQLGPPPANLSTRASRGTAIECASGPHDRGAGGSHARRSQENRSARQVLTAVGMVSALLFGAAAPAVAQDVVIHPIESDLASKPWVSVTASSGAATAAKATDGDV